MTKNAKKHLSNRRLTAGGKPRLEELSRRSVVPQIHSEQMRPTFEKMLRSVQF